jgi:uncharacterized protein
MKTFLFLVKMVAIVYCLLCVLLYFIQEKLIFLPEKQPADYKFSFNQDFGELYFTMADSTVLNGLLFKAGSSKGLIFYLHGNAGSLASWGSIAKTYTDQHYDLFMLDYRGYGKSRGHISNEKQFYQDVQAVYNEIVKKYDQSRIIVLGYSIGTGAAARLAATHQPRLLILQAPYFNLTDLVKQHFRIIPSFLLKYTFKTNVFLPACTMPVVIFHGDQDKVIYYGSSLKLKKLFKPADTLITLHGQGHNGMSDNPAYVFELGKILTR